MINLALLSKICEIPGAPGFEHAIRKFVAEESKSFANSSQIDNMGNLCLLKKGRSPKKVMITAHLDEISFMVSHIDEEGFIRFHPLGGFDPKTLTAQRVIVHGHEDIVGVMGCKPIHIMTMDERGKPLNIKDYYIDTGLSKDAVNKLISVGNPITRERALIQMGNCVNSKSLDNRVSVYILLESLKRLKDVEIPYDLHAVFTVQEEIGLRGAKTAAYAISPDWGINLDVTIAYDLPGAQPHEIVTRLGKGTAIKVMDGSVVCDYRMVEYLKQTATQHNIPWQADILHAGGTDTAAVQMAANGAIAGGISIPTRHIHQVIEMAHLDDIESSIQLLQQAICSLDKFDWAHK